jgi:hypothetical protein
VAQATERRGDYKSLVPPEYVDSADLALDRCFEHSHQRGEAVDPPVTWSGCPMGSRLSLRYVSGESQTTTPAALSRAS